MTDFKVGDVVRVIDDASTPEALVVRSNQKGFILCVSECGERACWEADYSLELVHRPDPLADIKQTIREVLLSDKFMRAFAAAWMKTPLPIREYAEPGEPTNATPSGLCCGGPKSDHDNFGECGHCGNMLCGRLQKSVSSESCSQANARMIPGAPVGWELVGFKQIQDEVKVFDENGEYWTFGGTNDAGDLTGALMPIFQKTEASNDRT